MEIDYNSKQGKFLIKTEVGEHSIVSGMPDRKFRPRTKIWGAPALRRNIEYMERHMNNPSMYTEEALKIYNERRSELTKPILGKEQFPSWFKFKNSPMDWQDKGLKKFFPLDVCGILYEQGLGKTFTSINLVTAWRMTNQIDAVLVICPSSVKLVWEEELVKHCPISFEPHVLQAGKYKPADKFIDNKSDFQWMIGSVESLSQGKAYDYMEKFLKSGRKVAIIIDESSRIKTPNKIRTDKCIKLGQFSTKRVILSGTSLTQGIEDWYTQFKFLNEDILGFDSFYTYRARYCDTISVQVGVNNWGQPINVIKVSGYKREDELINLVSPYVMRVEKKDVLELPDKSFVNRIVQMNPTQKKMYQDMKYEMYLEAEGQEEYEVATVLEQTMRLQQLTGGFYPHDDGEKIVPMPIKGKNPKIEEMKAYIDEVQGDIIIWCQFMPEIRLIADTLKKMEIGFVEFHGEKDDLEKKFAVKSFREDDNTRVFLATRAAAYGLTLTNASNALYFSQGHSLDQYSQSQDRNHRMGQNDKCVYTHLCCDKTVDLGIIDVLNGKQNLADMMYNMLKGKQ